MSVFIQYSFNAPKISDLPLMIFCPCYPQMSAAPTLALHIQGGVGVSNCSMIINAIAPNQSLFQKVLKIIRQALRSIDKESMEERGWRFIIMNPLFALPLVGAL